MHYHIENWENVLHVLPCGQKICIVLTEIRAEYIQTLSLSNQQGESLMFWISSRVTELSMFIRVRGVIDKYVTFG